MARARHAGIQFGAMALLFGVVGASGSACGDDDGRESPGSVGGASGASSTSGADGGPGGGATTDPGAPPAAGGGGTGSASNTPDAGGPTSDACIPGETRECTFDLLCTGVATCGSDRRFGGCECGTAGLVGGGIRGALRARRGLRRRRDLPARRQRHLPRRGGPGGGVLHLQLQHHQRRSVRR